MMNRVLDNRGIALPMAIFALVIVGALVAGSFFVGMQEQQVGRNTVKLQQAFASAEYGAQLTVANWSTDVYNALAVGGTTTIGGSLSGQQGWYRGQVTRLNQQLFLVRSEGFSTDSATRQQVGMLVRLRPIEINIKSALETQGSTKIGGSSQIDGHDTEPSGWSGCPSLEPPLPGIRINDASEISTSGCSDLSCVDGDPKVEEDTTITDSTLTTFGDADFDDLKALAGIVITGGNYKIQPVTSGGTCSKVVTNWGSPLDPDGPCGNYFAVVWVEGDITINGVQGQGILVVNGNLRVQGGFEFYGPVIVRKSLSTTGTGGHFNGGVVAANVDLEQNTVLGDAVVNFSNCALIRALSASASGALLRDRSWVNLN